MIKLKTWRLKSKDRSTVGNVIRNQSTKSHKQKYLLSQLLLEIKIFIIYIDYVTVVYNKERGLVSE